MVSMEERTSRLEGAFEQFAVVVRNMVTKEELRANKDELQSSIEGLRTEMHVSIEGLRTEMQVSIEKLRAEMRAEIRAAELRSTRWTVGSIFAASAIIIAAMKLLP